MWGAQHAAATIEACFPAPPPLQDGLPTQLRTALAALQDCAAGILQPSPSAATPAAVEQPLPADLAARLSQASERLGAVLAAQPPEQLPQRFADQVQPAASELVAALQAYWQLPQQRAAADLALAQAAATRSCAYLRCANLGAEGGPEAGEGVGSQRCRWAGRW